MSTGHILPMAALSTHPRLVPLSRLAVAAQPRLRLHPIAAAANAGAHAEAGRSVGEAELAQLWRLGGLSPACPPAVALGDTDNGRGVVVGGKLRSHTFINAAQLLCDGRLLPLRVEQESRQLILLCNSGWAGS